MFELPITPEEMRAVEERAVRMGVSKLLLMENAGKSIADFISTRVGSTGKRVVIVAGTGNNGGDGFVVARHMAAYDAVVTVFLVGSEASIRTEEASQNWQILKAMKRSIELVTLADSSFIGRLNDALKEADIIVDAIMGTGIKGELKEPHALIIEAINGSRAFKLAVDVPSGLDPLTGEISGRAVKADVTITFHRVKKGLLANPAVVGEIVITNIGIPPEVERGGLE